MTTRNLTLEEISQRSLEDHMPPVSELWRRIGGQDSELEKLVAGTLLVMNKAQTRKEKIDALVGLLAIATIIGYYGACQTYDDLMGIGDGGPPC